MCQLYRLTSQTQWLKFQIKLIRPKMDSPCLERNESLMTQAGET